MENTTSYINAIKIANINIASRLQLDVVNNIDSYSGSSYNDLNHAIMMLTEIITKGDEWPIDKSSRWLGFVQAKLVQHNIITIESEREETRDIFHSIYRESGINPPESIDLFKRL